MLFNSIDFALFLPLVFAGYWLLGSARRRAQNVWILLASYVFYGWWNWRFLGLIALSTLIDYWVARSLERLPHRQKVLLWISILANLGMLGVFKYYNFFVDSFRDAFSVLGYSMDGQHLAIVLPVGISFYTFQTLSYTIDVYRGELRASNNLIEFAAYVAFFPQLVAGPIERATRLLPQFQQRRRFDYGAAVDGLRQMLWGFFKKIVIADNAAAVVDSIFTNYSHHTGWALALGALFFAIQIYGDFSGYSDIAIGTARLFGFSLMQNFAFPYFSRDIAEFWRRWHISLSTWFRDYLYIPLGGSRGGRWKAARNVFIIFLVSGFWHGANYTFIAWGALHAALFLPLLLAGSNRRHLEVVAAGRLLPTFREGVAMLTTFAITCLAWIFFRAPNINVAWHYVVELFAGLGSLSSLQRAYAVLQVHFGRYLLLLLALAVLVEWWSRGQDHGLAALRRLHPRPLRWCVYLCVALAILFFGARQQSFIYFQF